MTVSQKKKKHRLSGLARASMKIENQKNKGQFGGPSGLRQRTFSSKKLNRPLNDSDNKRI